MSLLINELKDPTFAFGEICAILDQKPMPISDLNLCIQNNIIAQGGFANFSKKTGLDVNYLQNILHPLNKLLLHELNFLLQALGFSFNKNLENILLTAMV